MRWLAWHRQARPTMHSPSGTKLKASAERAVWARRRCGEWGGETAGRTPQFQGLLGANAKLGGLGAGLDDLGIPARPARPSSFLRLGRFLAHPSPEVSSDKVHNVGQLRVP
jgi:hypothetical protein